MFFPRKMTFTVRENHLSASSLDVKCNANIGDAYWQTSQAKIEIIGRPSYMLESRSNTNQGILLWNLTLKLNVWNLSRKRRIHSSHPASQHSFLFPPCPVKKKKKSWIKSQESVCVLWTWRTIHITYISIAFMFYLYIVW